MSVDRELCAAYREGLNNKIVAANARIDAEHSRIDVVDAKVDSLKLNEVAHLSREVQDIRRLRRSPLGRKEWAAIIVALIGAVAAIIKSYIR